ncbi:response regulator transcription factor [Paenibacillus alkalitolerans]|uniref:response regulator transcription factor n=1 Tax=Paenibacillus alkalitolerans TaxID=2799335 RepID=UPI0018F72322|nr:response regulator [Paenibacillus alkalitolerans]
MYKLLIADDEALVREAIKEQMKWAELGFECVADCEDGAVALEKVEQLRPDVVLTDICMPFMDGLDLTREISLKYPNTKVIILTGFDDFEYAQQAVKLKACDFVLKPVTASELSKVFAKVKEEMDQEFKTKKDFDLLRRQLNESLPLLKERFLERMVTSPVAKAEMDERFEFFGIEWAGPYFVELAVDIDDFAMDGQAPTEKSKELLRFAVYNIAQEIAAELKGAVVFRTREEKVLALLSGANPEQLIDTAYGIGERLSQAVASYLPLTVSVGIGHCCHTLDNIVHAHQSALSALDYRFLLGKNEVISITDMERRQKSAPLPAVEWEKQLSTKVKTGTEHEIKELIERIFAALRENYYTMETCTIYIQRLVLTLMHTVNELDGDVSAVFGPGTNPLTDVNKYLTLDEIERWMQDVCRRAVRTVMSVREHFSTDQVAKAQEYVKQNFQDAELSLKTVCKHVSMSTSYFSTLFKSHTGKTFIEYVTQVRMEKAKELLKLTQLKSYEIAYQVGFNDPHYFSLTFKKYTGDTPTEFRQKTIGEEATGRLSASDET